MKTKIKRIINIFLSIFNPHYFYYRVHHYFNKYVNDKKSISISLKNEKFYKKRNIETIKINTYDHSNQVVHPHLISYKDLIWFVSTPYPYGMEEYENPCIYYGKSIDSLVSIKDNPIAFQEYHCRGTHLSDPCFFINKDSLFCAYRSTINKGQSIENRILYKEILSNKVASDEHIIVASSEQLLSPAFVSFNNNLNMICVNLRRKGSVLTLYELNSDLQCINEKNINCKNIPNDFYIWHIDINNNESLKFKSLFLLRSQKNPGVFRLFYAHCVNAALMEWTIDCEVVIPPSIKGIVRIPYKSTFDTDGNVILSIRDKQSRYYLLKVGKKYGKSNEIK